MNYLVNPHGSSRYLIPVYSDEEVWDMLEEDDIPDASCEAAFRRLREQTQAAKEGRLCSG